MPKIRQGDAVHSLAIDSLRAQIRAPVLTASHPAYDDARRIWNAMFDRRPLLIVQPESAREVAAAICFAREDGLPLSVKGGGPGVARRAVCDDGVVVDLCRMADVRVDPAARVAVEQGGATLRAFDAAAQVHGIATTAGIYRETGVAGLALGGVVGLLMRRYGLTCDSLRLRSSQQKGTFSYQARINTPICFWALRGGGGNFGVVTRMVFRLHPLSHVYGGELTYYFDDAQALGRLYRDTRMS